MSQKKFAVRATLAMAAGLSTVNYGVSFRLPNQDPEAIARGNAFVATANNPSAIYYNPAGITQLEGQQVRAGIYAVSADTTYTSPTGVKAHTDATLQPVPELYYTFSPKDSQFSYGLGVYAPYGLGVDWGNNTPFALVGERGKVIYTCVNPVVAWQPCDAFSFGIGPTINWSQASFQQALPGPLSQFGFKGDGTDFGFNTGILLKVHEKVSIGASYRYLTTVNYKGHSEFAPLPRTETSAELRYPQFFMGGISFRPTDKWNIEFDIDWTDWDNVNAANFIGGAFPAGLVLNHKSTFMYEFGVTRQLPNNYFVSVGYFYSENSVPDATFNPLIPDANLHLGSIGFGHKGSQWDWALAYHFGYNGSGGRIVQGSPFGIADGRYETFNQAVNVAVTFKF